MPAPLPAQIKHLRRGGGDERPTVAVRARGGRRLTDRAEAVALLESGGGGEAGKPPADPQKDAVARSRAGGGGGEGEARGARRCWRRRWRGRRRSRSGGERVAASKTPARDVRSPFRLTCLRTAPTGGEEGGEPAGAVCAVAARWWCARGRRALVGDRSPRRAGSERGAHWPVCAVRDSQIAKSNKKNATPRLSQLLQWSASARRAPQVVLRFEKPPAFLSHRLVQLRLDRWQRKASRRIRDHRGWTPRRPALRRTPPNHHAGASSQRVSRCTPDGQRAPMAAWARRAPWPACRYEAQLLGRGAP